MSLVFAPRLEFSASCLGSAPGRAGALDGQARARAWRPAQLFTGDDVLASHHHAIAPAPFLRRRRAVCGSRIVDNGALA
jgi:hypothetical protein